MKNEVIHLDMLEEHIMEYVREQEFGYVTDIIKYLAKKNIEIKKSITELKKLIIDLFEKNENIKLSVDDKFQVIDVDVKKNSINEFGSIQNFLLGTIEAINIINYSKIYQDIKNSFDTFARLNCNNPNESDNTLNGLLDFSYFQVSFNFKQRDFYIRAMMKDYLEERESLLDYLSSLSQGIRKQRGSYIPLNFGLYLVFSIIRESLLKYNQEMTIVINEIKYIE